MIISFKVSQIKKPGSGFLKAIIFGLGSLLRVSLDEKVMFFFLTDNWLTGFHRNYGGFYD